MNAKRTSELFKNESFERNEVQDISDIFSTDAMFDKGPKKSSDKSQKKSSDSKSPPPKKGSTTYGTEVVVPQQPKPQQQQRPQQQQKPQQQQRPQQPRP